MTVPGVRPRCGLPPLLPPLACAHMYDGPDSSVGVRVRQVRQPHVEPTSSASLLISHPPLGAAVLTAVAANHTTSGSRSGEGRGGAGQAAACDVDRAVRFEVLLRHEGSSEWTTLRQVPEGGEKLPIEVRPRGDLAPSRGLA